MELETEAPSEFLAQIASFLPFNDVISLMQTSKTAYWKLQRHRNLLPKQKVELRIDFEYGAHFVQQLNFTVLFKTKARLREWERTRWRAILCRQSQNGTQSRNGDDQDKATLVESFYYSTRNNVLLERAFFLGHTEGLAAHLQFVLSHLHIDTLKLGQTVPLNDVYLLKITEKMKETNANVYILNIYQDLNKNMMDLIVACNPRRLLVRKSCNIPEEFFKLPVIRKLKRLTLEMFGHTIDINICSLAIPALNIASPSYIQATDYQRYLTQWIEKKREIQFFSFRRDMKVKIDDLKMLLSVIDKDLATVGRITDESAYGEPKISLQITRILDGATLHLVWNSANFTFSLLRV